MEIKVVIIRKYATFLLILVCVSLLIFLNFFLFFSSDIEFYSKNFETMKISCKIFFSPTAALFFSLKKSVHQLITKALPLIKYWWTLGKT